jgi:hypothetical protein
MDALTERGKPRNSSLDLFGYEPPPAYPTFPGSKSAGPSSEAARKIAGHASKVRAAALKEYRAAYPKGLGADQVAKLLGESVLCVRPRISELKAAGLLELTPERRQNDTGMSAGVLRITPQGLEVAQ